MIEVHEYTINGFLLYFMYKFIGNYGASVKIQDSKARDLRTYIELGVCEGHFISGHAET